MLVVRTMRFSQSTRGLKLRRRNPLTIVFHHATGALKINRHNDAVRVCIQGVFDQFHNNAIQVGDRSGRFNLGHYIWREGLDSGILRHTEMLFELHLTWWHQVIIRIATVSWRALDMTVDIIPTNGRESTATSIRKR